MENTQNTLERLEKENRVLKKLIVETEREMESIKAKAYEDIGKIKAAINWGPFCNLEARVNSFTQIQENREFNKPILLLGELDLVLLKAQNKVVEIQKQNKDLESEIGSKKNNYSRLLSTKQQNTQLISRLVMEKTELQVEIDNLHQKIKLFADKACETMPLSILTALNSS
jgi:hypothetical protein